MIYNSENVVKCMNNKHTYEVYKFKNRIKKWQNLLNLNLGFYGVLYLPFLQAFFH